MLDQTHDATLRSWVESANAPDSDFPVQNLPYGAFRRSGSDEPLRIGVAIGDQILDLKLAREQCPWGLGIDELLAPLSAGDLKPLMAAPAATRQLLRSALSMALTESSDQAPFLDLCLLPQAQAQMALPCTIGDYTDFFTGIHHATAVGKLFRPDNPLLPNYKWVPIAYHGRASSIGVSPQSFVRPTGQSLPAGATEPRFGPCQRLDYELELGVFVGAGNALGQPLDMAQAEEDWFGIVLLNDWSARDFQAWEYQPLGPFLAKNFATTISPWIVTREALEPFRLPFTRAEGDPQPLPYLDSPAHRERGQIDIALQVLLQTKAMQDKGLAPVELSRSNYRDAYWSVAQMLAHHSSGGCNLRTGDLLGTGTQSGPEPGQGGSLLELSNGGKQPLTLPGGETRTFLQDGDCLILRAHCERAGARRIGFGECRGTVLPALAR
jgi:fumarylacetoacetase